MYRDRTLMINKFIDEEAANEIISIILWMRETDSGTQYWAGFHILDIGENERELVSKLSV